MSAENNEFNLLWGYLTQLREELLESQKIRTQVIGFKISFVTALTGFLAAKIFSDYEKPEGFNNLYYYLLIIPAVAALFFDFLIVSYGFSIKRIGMYIKHILEPKLKELCPDLNIELWQEYLEHPFNKQTLATIGNLGLTIITILIAVFPIIWFNDQTGISIVSVMFFTLLIGVDIWAMKTSKRLMRNADNYFIPNGSSTRQNFIKEKELPKDKNKRK